MTHRPSPKVSVISVDDVIDDVTEQCNKDSEDAGFCGEPFADEGELLASLTPLLFSMKLFGLYFERGDRIHRRRADDPECDPTTPTAHTSSTRLRVYATFMLFAIWFNAVRFLTVFNGRDHFGALLLMKITMLTWVGLIAIFYTAYYYACRTGRLLKVLLTLAVTRDSVRSVRRVVIGATAFNWLLLVGDTSVGAYVFFNSNVDHNFIHTPFFTHIHVPENVQPLTIGIGYIGYVAFFAGVYFAHSMNQVLVYIFYSEFKKLKKNFRRVLGEQGQFEGNFSLFRRRHQTLSRAVSKVVYPSVPSGSQPF